MTARPGTPRPRTIGHARRTRTVRRRSAGLTPARAGGLLAMVVAALGIYGAGASGAFGLRDVVIAGNRFTSEAAVRGALAVEPDANLFLLSTGPLRERLESLPTVSSASVAVALPASLEVSLTERTPILAWSAGGRQLLVDAGGRAFADVTGDDDPAVAAAVRGLPVVSDERAASATLAVGATLDPIDFDVATRLGSLRPADVGSAADGLAVAVTDADGFVVSSVPAGWTAVFGFYTPTLRTPELVPGQVRLLRSLLAGREAQVARIVLASETDGTFVPRTTPRPSPPAGATPRP